MIKTATRALRALLIRAAWLVAAVLIALGGAGIVAAMDHVPGTASRPELTWSGDQAAEPALDAATVELEQLANEVDTLGTSARLALSQVVAGDPQSLDATIATGTLQLATVEGQARTLETSLDAVPGSGELAALRLSPDVRFRFDELAKTRGLTAGLAAGWAAFTGRALDAASLTRLLSEHDTQTAIAANAGAAGKYEQALTELDKSDTILTRSRTLRDDLAPTTDVSTLTEWLTRNGDYDAALRALYRALLDSGGKVTANVRAAFDAEHAARMQLPGDTRALVVIMGDVARGGLNQAVILIEQARGSLNSALEVQRGLQLGAGLPG